MAETKNMLIEFEDEETMLIRVKINKHFGPSSTGKTNIVATSSGAKVIKGLPGFLINASILLQAKYVEQYERDGYPIPPISGKKRTTKKKGKGK